MCVCVSATLAVTEMTSRNEKTFHIAARLCLRFAIAFTICLRAKLNIEAKTA